MRLILPLLLLCVAIGVMSGKDEPAQAARRAGVAKVDVTPDGPVRLTGYAGRAGESTGSATRLYAKALAILDEGMPPALWLTLDNCGLTREVWTKVRDSIVKRTSVPAERIVLTMSHTHTAPATTDWAPFIQPETMTAEEQQRIDAYTESLVEKLASVASAALREPFAARFSWSEGRAGFAANRRTPGGPVDHAVPVLKAEDISGKLRAVVTSYACHCTTCGGQVLQTCGDWAGFASEAIERDHPGAVALVAIGCGADSNPSPRGGPDGGLALSRQHGETLAAEVKRLLAQPFKPLSGKLQTRRIDCPLPFAPAFTREEWQQRAQKTDITGRHARHWLQNIDKGRAVPPHLEYEVAAWHFGDELALVFLPGEVVVDYSLRLKRELDPARLWINAYSQWVPCYIPSRRILQEGGYEAEQSLWYYGRPGRLAPECEDVLVKAAGDAVPEGFRAKQAGRAPN